MLIQIRPCVSLFQTPSSLTNQLLRPKFLISSSKVTSGSSNRGFLLTGETGSELWRLFPRSKKPFNQIRKTSTWFKNTWRNLCFTINENLISDAMGFSLLSMDKGKDISIKMDTFERLLSNTPSSISRIEWFTSQTMLSRRKQAAMANLKNQIKFPIKNLKSIFRSNIKNTQTLLLRTYIFRSK